MVVEHREEIKFKFNSKQKYNFLKKYKLDYPLYKKRKVNSLYFDTIGFDIYKNSQFQDIGVEKVRLRYYGENESSVTKEVKVTTSLGKRKYSEPMSKKLSEYKKGMFHRNNILYAIGNSSVSHIILTHSHQDHCALAIRLAIETGATIFLWDMFVLCMGY
mgnify:CR=1 FL=1